MPNLTDSELAALDLVIAAKKEGMLPNAFIEGVQAVVNNAANDANNLANNAKNVGEAVVVTAAAVAAVTAVAAGVVNEGQDLSVKAPKDYSLSDLMAIRRNALQARGQ